MAKKLTREDVMRSHSGDITAVCVLGKYWMPVDTKRGCTSMMVPGLTMRVSVGDLIGRIDYSIFDPEMDSAGMGMAFDRELDGQVVRERADSILAGACFTNRIQLRLDPADLDAIIFEGNTATLPARLRFGNIDGKHTIKAFMLAASELTPKQLAELMSRELDVLVLFTTPEVASRVFLDTNSGKAVSEGPRLRVVISNLERRPDTVTRLMAANSILRDGGNLSKKERPDGLTTRRILSYAQAWQSFEVWQKLRSSDGRSSLRHAIYMDGSEVGNRTLSFTSFQMYFGGLVVPLLWERGFEDTSRMARLLDDWLWAVEQVYPDVEYRDNQKKNPFVTYRASGFHTLMMLLKDIIERPECKGDPSRLGRKLFVELLRRADAGGFSLDQWTRSAWTATGGSGNNATYAAHKRNQLCFAMAGQSSPVGLGDTKGTRLEDNKMALFHLGEVLRQLLQARGLDAGRKKA